MVATVDSTQRQVMLTNNDEVVQMRSGKDILVFGWRPKCLQWLHTSSGLTALMTLCFLWQNFAVNGLLPPVISTLEKRFGLSSTSSGLLSTAYNIAAVAALLPLLHFADRVHRGKCIIVGQAIFIIGSIIFMLPQFLSQPYEAPTANYDAKLCTDKQNTSHTTTSASGWALALLITGHGLHGAGVTPLHVLSLPYLDDNTPVRHVPHAIMHLRAWPALGVVIGFFVASFTLHIYGDFYRVDVARTDLHSHSDPRWYGAWWIGYVLSATLCLLTTIPLFGFAKVLPMKESEADQKKRQQADERISERVAELSLDVKTLPSRVWALMSSVPYAFLRIAEVCNSLILNAFLVFLPKIVENFYNVTPSVAGTVVGAIFVPCCFAGTLIGGMIVQRYQLNVRRCFLFLMLTNIVVFGGTFVFLTYCDVQPFFGADANSTKINIHQPCNEQCNTCTDRYEPICDTRSGVTFYSSCYAGCMAQEKLPRRSVNKGHRWLHCACAVSQNATLVDGVCSEHNFCSQLYIFLVVFGIAAIFMFMQLVPLSQLAIRIVPASQRGLSVAIGLLLVRIFGNIPGAVLTGALIDASCSLWNEDPRRRFCIRYSVPMASKLILIISLALRGVIIVANFISYYTYQDGRQSTYRQETPTSVKTSDSVLRYDRTNNDVTVERLSTT